MSVLKQLTLLLFLLFQIFSSRVFIFLVFCNLPNKPNSASSGICLFFKSRHLELFYKIKIIIQLSSTGIFLGLWSRGPPCTLQLYRTTIFLGQLWMAASNHHLITLRSRINEPPLSSPLIFFEKKFDSDPPRYSNPLPPLINFRKISSPPAY